MKKWLGKFGNVFVLSILGLAVTNLNAACMFWAHQPEVPECLRDSE